MKKCCGTYVPHCHCGGDKGHNILPGCPGYGEKENWDDLYPRLDRLSQEELIDIVGYLMGKVAK